MNKVCVRLSLFLYLNKFYQPRMDYRIMEKNGEVRVDETLTGIKGRAFYSSLNIIIIIIT